MIGPLGASTRGSTCPFLAKGPHGAQKRWMSWRGLCRRWIMPPHIHGMILHTSHVRLNECVEVRRVWEWRLVHWRWCSCWRLIEGTFVHLGPIHVHEGIPL